MMKHFETLFNKFEALFNTFDTDIRDLLIRFSFFAFLAGVFLGAVLAAILL
jgi:hypothetical protein